MGLNKCLACGYCCTISLCQFGRYKLNTTICKYLNEYKKCNIYKQIKSDSKSYMSPAFNSECCQPNNIYRSIKELNEKTL